MARYEDYEPFYRPYRWAIVELETELGELQVAMGEDTDCGNRLSVAVYPADMEHDRETRRARRVIVHLEHDDFDANRLSETERARWLRDVVRQLRERGL